VLVVLMALMGAVLAVATPASAAVVAFGPPDPIKGFPSFYTDDAGLSLQPCLDGPPLCLSAAADLVSPDGEGFYYNAQATAGGFIVGEAVEAAFFAAGDGQQTTFQRTQVSHRKVGLVPNSTYTITDPYGAFTCSSNAAGDIPNNNACRIQTGGAVALDFTSTLGGRIGPFLTWDTIGQAGAPPLGYIGDGITPHAVIGSPTGFNKARVEGPGANETPSVDMCPDVLGNPADCVESDQWVVAGKTIDGPVGVLSATSLTLPPTSVGSTSPAQSLTYTSVGTAPATISDIKITGAQPKDFTLDDAACLTTLVPGTSCVMSATYSPATAGLSSADLTITDDSGSSPHTVSLSGSSVGVLSVPATSVSFGQLRVGSSASRSVTITNTGVAALPAPSLSATGAGFSASAGTCTASLAPNASCSVAATMQPTAVEPLSGVLTVSSGGATKQVSLGGTGALGVALVDQSALHFADTVSGSVSSGSAATVTNTGAVPLLVANATLTGTGAGDFTLSQGTCGGFLEPRSSCVLAVQFSPRSAGVKLASLQIPNDTGVRTVALSGTATNPLVLPLPPVVTLPVKPPVVTSPPVDTVKPTVSRRSPTSKAVRVPRGATVSVRFSERVVGVSARTVTLTDVRTGRKVTVRVSYSTGTHVATLDPTTRLGAHRRYVVSLTSGIRDAAGNRLTTAAWTFTTRR
jgi:Bacterial Ig-like domain/Abnormal spindle-like microcephaly-assoc'd, ASPM-SPD-2-Hydin